MIAIGICIIVIYLLFFVPVRMAYGGYIGDNELYDPLFDGKERINYNCYDREIFTIGGLTFAPHIGIPVFSKFYCMSGGGLVWRWSKSHKILEEVYKKRLEN